jgi:hypothetical protein
MVCLLVGLGRNCGSRVEAGRKYCSWAEADTKACMAEE